MTLYSKDVYDPGTTSSWPRCVNCGQQMMAFNSVTGWYCMMVECQAKKYMSPVHDHDCPKCKGTGKVKENPWKIEYP